MFIAQCDYDERSSYPEPTAQGAIESLADELLSELEEHEECEIGFTVTIDAWETKLTTVARAIDEDGQDSSQTGCLSDDDPWLMPTKIVASATMALTWDRDKCEWLWIREADR
jgi:hypothetical protein